MSQILPPDDRELIQSAISLQTGCVFNESDSKAFPIKRNEINGNEETENHMLGHLSIFDSWCS